MTIRELRCWVNGDPRYEAVCVRCGERIAEFSNPERAREAIEANRGAIIKGAHYLADCLAACANKCLCQRCGALLENDSCPNCCNDDT